MLSLGGIVVKSLLIRWVWTVCIYMYMYMYMYICDRLTTCTCSTLFATVHVCTCMYMYATRFFMQKTNKWTFCVTNFWGCTEQQNSKHCLPQNSLFPRVSFQAWPVGDGTILGASDVHVRTLLLIIKIFYF